MVNLYEDLIDCIKEYGILKGIYHSDIFFPIYNLIHLPKRIYNYIDKFIYYGKAGTKTYDFDANGVDDLIYAHIKRVRKFMDSDKTHLVWNSERKKGLIRKLYEFEELCKRKCRYDDFDSHYYLGKELDKYGMGTRKEIIRNGQKYYTYEKTKEHKRKLSVARKKDKFISKQLRARYYELLSNYVAGFWD